MSDYRKRIVGSLAVNEHINKPVPSVLWHYTSFDGFMGIVKSKKIWSTEYRFLNDSEEFLHARNLAIELLEEEPELLENQLPARDMIRNAVKDTFDLGPLNEDRLQLMVASFSEAGDQLSQWRGYSGNTTGVSLGLDLTAMRPPLEAETAVTFAPCLYKDSDKRALLKSIFLHYRANLCNYWDSFINLANSKQSEEGTINWETTPRFIVAHAEEKRPLLAHSLHELRFDLVRVAPLLKNENFSEEKEWRLVLPKESETMPSDHPVEFTARRNSLVPYIPFPFSFKNATASIPLKDLVLGPGSHAAAKLSANMFLKAHLIDPVAKLSKIPYRPT